VTGPLLALAPLRLEGRAVAAGAPGATVLRTGMGPRRAGAAAARIRAGLAAAAADPSTGPGSSTAPHPGAGVDPRAAAPGRGAVAVMGVGGALVDDLAPGHVVVADRVVRPSGETVIRLPSAGLIAADLRRAGITVHVGAVVSTDRIVLGRRARARLATGSGAIVVDMESAALLDQPWGLPAAVVRAVSDRPGQELWSPSGVGHGLTALRALRASAPTLQRWAAAAGPREVVLAAPRSFCAGVERAIDTVLAGLERFGAPVYVRRQIVHNEFVVASLEARGAIFVHELDEVPTGATVVFSAHGVAPAVRSDADARGLRVVDATCPLVAKVHREIRRFAARGRHIVLIGHAGHDEIEGTLGEAADIRLVTSPGDVAALDLDDDAAVAYATQTTLSPRDVDATVDALRRRFDDLTGPPASDICYATHNRQEAVAAVAGDCDLVLVVGSPGSSNSRRLVEVVQRAGGAVELIASEADLSLESLLTAHRVGLTAGASTPEVLVQGVVDALAGLGPVVIDHRAVRRETVSFPLPSEVR
jgi:4-hydroxy-3-methylbut-2-enyl diphosphate reductase